MPGKSRPSLREKTLQNVALSNLSLTDKKCIESVFEKFEALSKADVAEVKQIEIVRDDLKWWLKTNSEKGVVHIPEFVVENMIAKMDGGNAE